MKILIEVKGTPTKDNVLIFDGINWIPIRKSQLLSELVAEDRKLSKRLDESEKRINAILEKIDAKLKEHHQALQVLIKEGE